MQGDSIIQDPITREYLTREELYRARQSCQWIIGVMRDIDSGIVHMSMIEYLKLPAMFHKIHQLYIDIRDAYAK